MARPKKIKEGERVSVVMSKKQLDWVRYKAIQMSHQEGRQITVSEAIRMAVEAAYTPPKDMQLYMFPNEEGVLPM